MGIKEISEDRFMKLEEKVELVMKVINELKILDGSD